MAIRESIIPNRNPPPAEQTFLQSVIDLAIARRSKSGNGEFLDWHSLHSSFQDLASQLHLDPLLQNRCYQILLLMHADTGSDLTWWDKVRKIPQYLAYLQKKKKGEP